MSQLWTVVLPFRGGVRSKSRLAATGGRPGDVPRLAAAMLFDVAAAALAADGVGRVVVLSHTPPVLPAALREQTRLSLVSETAPGLNGALDGWLATAAGQRVAVVQPDLPALTPSVLGDVLRRAGALLEDGAPAVVVPDDTGTGTTVLAGAAEALRPRFGPDSARRHRRGGAVRLDPGEARLQADVDTTSDLHRACELGLGAYTTAASDAADRFAGRG